MAEDSLKYPITFDIKSALDDVANLSKRITTAMSKNPAVIKVDVGYAANSIDSIKTKLKELNEKWNALQFGGNGRLTEDAQTLLKKYQLLTQQLVTAGQTLSQVTRNMAKAEAETTRAITAEYDKRQKAIDAQIKAKERQAAAEERVRQAQTKGVNVGYIQIQTDAVRNLRSQYEALLPMLNALQQKRVDIKLQIDKSFESEVNKIKSQIDSLRQANLNIGAKGDVGAINANNAAIKQLETQLKQLETHKLQLFNDNEINAQLARVKTEVSGVFAQLQAAEQQLAKDQSVNAALDAQSQKVLKLHADIQKLDAQIAQMNSQGKMYNGNGGFTSEGTAILQQRIALTKQLEQASITGAEAQAQLERQLRAEAQQTAREQQAAAKAAEAQRQAEIAARKEAMNSAREKVKILNKEAKTIDDITAKLHIQQQRLNNTQIGSAKFTKIAAEIRNLTEQLERANAATQKLHVQHIKLGSGVVSSNSQQQASIKQTSAAVREHETYVSRLLKRLMVYASFSMFGNFITQVREVTAQFELQRVSLGAIIQDQIKANQIFAEIKSFALQSPLKIMDLTKYTKQLAAYKIGVDDLFDTTKRLADISVGLGVPMERLILAYGQVKATGYLRASEVRQFTEAGLPIVESIAQKLTEVNGELVKASDVMDMISKREVPFQMVADVFKDLTDKGGMFYDMQVKQGNTLYGMWQKLGDAASMMFNDIGTNSTVNDAMKGLISTLRSLMLHWKQAGIVLSGFIAFLAYYKLAAKNAAIQTAAMSGANAKEIASIEAKIAALKAEQASLGKGLSLKKLHTAASLSAANAELKGAQATNVFTKSLNKLKAAFMSNIFGLILTVLATVIALIVTAEDEMDKLNSKIRDINNKYADESKKMIDRFKELVKVATTSVDGSKRQKEALDELNRTYGNILGSENLEIRNLRAMKDGYAELIQMINAYNAKRAGEERANEIKQTYSSTMESAEKSLKSYLGSRGLDSVEQAEFIDAMIERLHDGMSAIEAYQRTAKEFEDKMNSVVSTIFNNGMWGIFSGTYIDTLKTIYNFATEGTDVLYGYGRAYESLNAALAENERLTQEQISEYGDLTKYVEYLTKALQEYDYTSATAYNASVKNKDGSSKTVPIGWQHTEILKGGFKSVNDNLDDYEKNLVEAYNRTKKIMDAIDTLFSQTKGETLPSSWYAQTADAIIINFDKLKEVATDPTLKAAINGVQKIYESVSPSNDTVRSVNDKMHSIATSMGGWQSYFHSFLMANDASLEKHRKKLEDELENLKKALIEYTYTKTLLSLSGLSTDSIEEDIDKTTKKIEFLEKTLKELPTFGEKNKKRGGAKSDNRLQTLREIEQSLSDIYKRYEDLQKVEGNTKALSDIKKVYEGQLDYINKLSRENKFGLKFTDLPTSFKSLQDYRDAIIKVINKLRMKGYEKAALELEMKIGNANIDKQAKEVEKQLKELAEKVQQTKTAKEFYDKILGQIGDKDLSNEIANAVYGANGDQLFEDTVAHINKIFEGIDLTSAIDKTNRRIDYNALSKLYARYENQIVEQNRSTAKKIISEGQKTLAANISNWEKELATAKSYEQKRTEIIETAAKQREKIIKDTQGAPDERDRLLNLNRDKETKDLAVLDSNEFKKSELYIKTFEDLGNAASSALSMMKKKLQALIETQKDILPATELKTYIDNLNKIESEELSRDPLKAITVSYRNLKKARADLKVAQSAQTNAHAEYDLQQPILEQQIADAQNAQAEAAAKVAQYRAEGTLETVNGVTAQIQLNKAEETTNALLNKQKKAKDKVNKADEAVENGNNGVEKAQKDINKAVQAYAALLGNVASTIRNIVDLLGIAEDTDLGTIATSLATGFEQAASALNLCLTISEALKNSNAWLLGISAAIGVMTGLFSWFSNAKVRKANAEIEKQQKLLDRLEYSYSQLEKTADKLFGTDYITNYNQQLRVLQMEQLAYLEQARWERSKGKKADEDKIKDYEEKARDAADQIKELQESLTEHFLGTDHTSAAKEFAQAWIEAKATFASTTDAIKSKYKDMIKSIVVEGAAAKIIDSILKPMWDKMDGILSNSDINGAIDYLIKGMDTFITQANSGMNVLWESLKAKGYNVSQLFGDSDSSTSGIAKEVSSATSEEINALAAGINTQNFYISHVPTISENVMAIRKYFEAGGVVNTGVTVDNTALQNEAMSHYAAIENNTAASVRELQNIVTILSRMTTFDKGTAGMRVYLK